MNTLPPPPPPSRILRQEKHPFWSLKSHSPIDENTLIWHSKHMHCALHSLFHPLVPGKASSCHKVQCWRSPAWIEKTIMISVGLWTFNVLPYRSPKRSGFKRTQLSTTHKCTCTSEICLTRAHTSPWDFFNSKINKKGGGKQRKPLSLIISVNLVLGTLRKISSF